MYFPDETTRNFSLDYRFFLKKIAVLLLTYLPSLFQLKRLKAYRSIERETVGPSDKLEAIKETLFVWLRFLCYLTLLFQLNMLHSVKSDVNVIVDNKWVTMWK
jgi:hypothetical protein